MTIETNRYNILKEYNYELKEENEKLISNVNLHLAKNFELQKENKKLKKEIDDFYYEQSKLKESDFYIKALKNQLFNAYLEIESDNVNIQLSHYHIKKLLKIIDEHTLINPYTN